VIRDGVLIDFRDAALLGAQTTGEITEVVDRQRNIGVQRFANRFTVIPTLGER